MLQMLFVSYRLAVSSEFSGRKPVTVDILHGIHPRKGIPSNSDEYKLRQKHGHIFII